MGLVSQAVHDGGRHVIGWVSVSFSPSLHLKKKKDGHFRLWNKIGELVLVVFLFLFSIPTNFLSCNCLYAELFPRRSCLERYVCYISQKKSLEPFSCFLYLFPFFLVWGVIVEYFFSFHHGLGLNKFFWDRFRLMFNSTLLLRLDFSSEILCFLSWLLATSTFSSLVLSCLTFFKLYLCNTLAGFSRLFFFYAW